MAHISSVAVEIKEQRKERLVARVSGADKALIKRAASLEGRSVAMFVIVHAREVAKQIVADNDNIRLNASQSQRFVEELLRPTPPVPPRLRKAVAAYRRRVS